MSVYKEGFYIIHNLKLHPVIRRGDRYWNNLKQLVSDYGIPETRELRQGVKALCVTQIVKLYSEGDRPRLHNYRVSYRTENGNVGLVTITELPGATH